MTDAEIEELLRLSRAATDPMKRVDTKGIVTICNAVPKLVERVRAYGTALNEIAKGEGAYSRDPLEHATNTIEDMKRLAREARGDIA